MTRDDRGTRGKPQEENFRDLLESTYSEPARLEPGEKVAARVIGITSEHVFLDLGRKGEGCLERKELHDREGNLTAREGDTVQAYYVGTKDNEMWFTTRIMGGTVGQSQLEDAWRSGIPVEGSVEREIKGGFEVRVAGGFRGFCPHSQMGNEPGASRGESVGKRLSFRITRYDGKGSNIVLSRRALLEEMRGEEKESLRKTLREGMTVKGTITSVKEFGAFVRVGPIEGLVPASEVGWDRTGDVREALAEGQEVEIVVVQLDWERDRFTFSMKRRLSDPWDRVEGKYPAGSRHQGKVSRLAAFGAFVILEPGVDGLLHISHLGGGKKIRHPGEAVREGEELSVTVDSVDLAKRRISLSLAGEDIGEERDGPAADALRFPREDPPPIGTLGEALKAKLAEKRGKGKS